MLPSPLAFPTPVATKSTGFEEDDRKRKLEESSASGEKRVKT